MEIRMQIVEWGEVIR